jgi:hypothetical protein
MKAGTDVFITKGACKENAFLTKPLMLIGLCSPAHLSVPAFIRCCVLIDPHGDPMPLLVTAN